MKTVSKRQETVHFRRGPVHQKCEFNFREVTSPFLERATSIVHFAKVQKRELSKYFRSVAELAAFKSDKVSVEENLVRKFVQLKKYLVNKYNYT